MLFPLSWLVTLWKFIIIETIQMINIIKYIPVKLYSSYIPVKLGDIFTRMEGSGSLQTKRKC